jgi:hypothetical protein
MIFYDSHNLNLGFNWIAIYSGPQPTMEDYIANYDSLYSFTGSNLLQVIKANGYGFSNESIETIYTIVTESETEGYAQGLYSVRAGEGTWATLRPSLYGLSGISADGRQVSDIFDSYYNGLLLPSFPLVVQ